MRVLVESNEVADLDAAGHHCAVLGRSVALEVDMVVKGLQGAVAFGFACAGC